jgi:hypothetical protein
MLLNLFRKLDSSNRDCCSVESFELEHRSYPMFDSATAISRAQAQPEGVPVIVLDHLTEMQKRAYVLGPDWFQRCGNQRANALKTRPGQTFASGS